MRLLTELREPPARLGLLPGTFNPPTRAHFGLAEAALAHVDHVLMILPGELPHKTWEGASREERLEMLRVATMEFPRVGAALSEGGLFIDMVREARIWFPETEFYLVCGRDAAERIIGWDYNEAQTIERMLQEFRLLVASRHGPYEPPQHLAYAVRTLAAGCWDECSSTEVRRAIAAGEDWMQMVPGELTEIVRRVYGT